MSYDSSNGANFVITTKTGAPTMSTSKYIMFGKVTAVVKASPGTGIVSSFILESDDLDEIDWEWLGSTDSSVESNFFGKGNTTSYDRAVYHDVSTPIESFHSYVIDWTAERIVWSIDGTTVRTLLYTDPVALYGKNYPQTPMMIKMGSWVGCPDASDTAIAGTCSWAGGQAVFPATDTMYVKSVTIEDYGTAVCYAYGDETGSYTSIESITDSSKCGSAVSQSSASSSGSSTASAKKASSTSTTSGAIFAATTSTSSGSSATATGSSSSGIKTSTTSGSASKTTSSAASSTTSSSSTATNGASSKKLGSIEFSVMAFGLGLGYLVM